jgi:hypothetical protein
MTKKRFLDYWKRETSGIQRPLDLDCIIAREIVYEAYRAGFINLKVHSLALERINMTFNRAVNENWMYKNSDIEAYEELIEKKWYEDSIEKTRQQLLMGNKESSN